MIDDREMLELAAKAGDVELGDEITECGISLTMEDGRHRSLQKWNPLTDDGDALRLAVKCNIDFYQGDNDGPAAYAGYYIVKRQRFCVERHEDSGTDPYAATRRAIVRAASEIGRTMV